MSPESQVERAGDGAGKGGRGQIMQDQVEAIIYLFIQQIFTEHVLRIIQRFKNQRGVFGLD